MFSALAIWNSYLFSTLQHCEFFDSQRTGFLPLQGGSCKKKSHFSTQKEGSAKRSPSHKFLCHLSLKVLLHTPIWNTSYRLLAFWGGQRTEMIIESKMQQQLSRLPWCLLHDQTCFVLALTKPHRKTWTPGSYNGKFCLCVYTVTIGLAYLQPMGVSQYV